MAENQFTPGDIVIHKAGSYEGRSIKMVVAGYAGRPPGTPLIASYNAQGQGIDKWVLCRWQAGDSFKTETFIEAELNKVG